MLFLNKKSFAHCAQNLPIKKQVKQRRGFTLMEVVIVVAIIIILTAIAIPNYLNAMNRSKISSVKQTINIMGGVLEEYRIEWGTYPHDMSKTLTIETFGHGKYNSSLMEKEVTGNGTLNSATAHNPTMDGYKSPIKYITVNSLEGIRNPWFTNRHYIYASDGKSYVIYVKMKNNRYIYAESKGQAGVITPIEIANNLNDIPDPFTEPLTDPEG